MTPLEKLQHYAGRVYVFESKNHFAIGKYTFSEYLFLIIVGSAQAQEQKNGIGIRLGSPLGITYKKYLPKDRSSRW